MRFLADDEHVDRAIRPERQLEGHAAENRGDGIHDFGGNAGQLEGRDRAVISRDAEICAIVSMIVSLIVLLENMKWLEGVVDRRHDAHLQRPQKRLFTAAFQTPDPLVDEGHEIGDR